MSAIFVACNRNTPLVCDACKVEYMIRVEVETRNAELTLEQTGPPSPQEDDEYNICGDCTGALYTDCENYRECYPEADGSEEESWYE